MAFYFYLSTKIIMVFITKSYQDLFGVRSYINAFLKRFSGRDFPYGMYYPTPSDSAETTHLSYFPL